jgi:hypothetical protein
MYKPADRVKEAELERKEIVYIFFLVYSLDSSGIGHVYIGVYFG